VFGSGHLEAPLVVIGEAPGSAEDQSGIPFVGRSGKLLRLYLKEEELGPERVFITNTVRCRPPNNRDPFPAETYACSEHLYNTIELVSPLALLAVGAVASKALTGDVASMAEYREKSGEWEYPTPYPISLPVFCTYHPAYILRRPDMASCLREDLQKVREFIDGQQAKA
jgi:DNA polymerase